MSADIRKIAVWVEETHQEAGRARRARDSQSGSCRSYREPVCGGIR